MKLRLALAALALAALGTGSANAATVYDAVGQFSLSNPSGVWSYGFGDASAGGFTAMQTSGTNFLNISGLDYWQGVPQASSVPAVAYNTTGSPVATGTLFMPTDVLLIHPAIQDQDPNSDVIVRFTAPSAGTYTYRGLFELLDNHPSGVIGEVFYGTTSLYSGTLTSPAANLGTYTPGQFETFNGTVHLNGGDTLFFAVNNDGVYYNDSTGFNVTISAVPEPATWAMLLIGFGAIGFAVRGARKSSGAVTA